MNTPRNPQIVNFQITPYSDEIADYVNNLSILQIYQIFSNQYNLDRSDLLTAALLAICKIEYNFLTEIQKSWKLSNTNIGGKIYIESNNSTIRKSLLLDEMKILCSKNLLSITINTVSTLITSYIRDKLLFDTNLNDLGQYPHVFVAVINSMYSGHAYAWTVEIENSRVSNIIGLRSGIVPLLTENCDLRQRGLIPMLFDSIQQWALSGGSMAPGESSPTLNLDNPVEHYIRIIQPNNIISEFAVNCGFTMIKPFRNNNRLKWLFDNTSLGATPLTNGLILREYDYIFNISHSLQCPHVQYLYIQT